MPVIYSLGNFAFGTRGRYTEDIPGIGLTVTTEISEPGRLKREARPRLRPTRISRG